MLNTTLMEYDVDEIHKRMLEGGEILKVRDNRTFHALVNSQDKDATLWFMSQILERPMKDIKKIIKIENSELKPLNLYDKGKIVDFIVSVGQDVVVVEMNNNNSGQNYIRNLFYTFHSILNKVEIGEKYDNVHGILVNLNWFNENECQLQKMPGVVEVKYPYPVIGKEEKESIIIVKNINLSFYDKMVYNGVKMKDFIWKLFTINKLEEIHDVKKNIKELSHYCSEIERLSSDKEYCMSIWSERIEENLSDLAVYNKGKEEGQKEGIIAGKREMIINMYQKEIPINVIAECAKLSKEEIQEIIASLKN